MAFDTLVSNAGRLEILTALAVEETQDFVTLRKRTHLTDGNLASHAKRLQSAGLVNVNKTFRDGKPVTSYHLTPDGRKALESHVRRLMSALSQRRISGPAQLTPEINGGTERSRTPIAVESIAAGVFSQRSADDEWVD
jgi:DNA-binding MarR family transcriptional regulator